MSLCNTCAISECRLCSQRACYSERVPSIQQFYSTHRIGGLEEFFDASIIMQGPGHMELVWRKCRATKLQNTEIAGTEPSFCDQQWISKAESFLAFSVLNGWAYLCSSDPVPIPVGHDNSNFYIPLYEKFTAGSIYFSGASLYRRRIVPNKEYFAESNIGQRRGNSETEKPGILSYTFIKTVDNLFPIGNEQVKAHWERTEVLGRLNSCCANVVSQCHSM